MHTHTKDNIHKGHWNGHYQMNDEHIKRLSSSLVIREFKLKAYFKATAWDKFNSDAVRTLGSGSLEHKTCWWKCQLPQPRWTIVGIVQWGCRGVYPWPAIPLCGRDPPACRRRIVHPSFVVGKNHHCSEDGLWVHDGAQLCECTHNGHSICRNDSYIRLHF